MATNSLTGKHLILVQAEKGGVGKTTIVDALAADLQAINSKVLVVDCDDDNSGFVRRSGMEGTVALPWATGPDDAPGWCDRSFSENDVIIIDCGANLLASARPVNGFLGELVLRVAEQGGIITPFAVTSTNAPGVDRLALHMRDMYSTLGKVCLVQNNQDGSGAFPASLTTLGLPTARFNHISPGIMAARLLSERPLLAILKAPPENHSIAMGCLARIVADFLNQPPIAALLTPAAAEAVRALSGRALGPFQRTVTSLRSATDAALRANAALYEARQMLRHTALTDATNHEAIAKAALQWIEAENCAI